MGFRILAVNWQDLKNPLAGGAEVHLQEILSRLGHWGHEVTLLCSGFADAPIEETYNGQRIIRRGRRMNFNWVAPLHARRLLAEKKYDIILEDINKIPFYLPLFSRVPLLAIVPHLFATTVFQEINPVLATYIYLMERPVSVVYKKSPWMVISESTRDDLVARGVPSANITVIHCGIDHQVYHPAPDGARFTQPTIVYLGRLKKYKSVDHIIRAASGLPDSVGDWRLVIIGEGDDRPRLEGLTRELKLTQRITFTGFVDQTTKVDYLRRAHIAVCASLKEGWGLTNIEANACGTPVVAADVPGLRDSARDGETGLLFPHGDIVALRERLTRLLVDRGLWEKLSRGGLAWAASFHWDETARATEALIGRIIAGRTGQGASL